LRWLRAYAIHLALFDVGLDVYGADAGTRLAARSSNPHFALQADAWLRGKVTIDHPVGDDWAKVETVVLDDGSRVSGRQLASRKAFRVTGGGEIPTSRIVHREGTTVYMSFPPAPAVLMLPQVLVSGARANDVLFTVVFAAAVLPLLFATQRRLWAAGLSRRSVVDDLWLTAMFAFGSVFFFASVGGKVWYTAHVVGVFFALAYAWASIEARYPILAGLALGVAATTRTPTAFMFPLFFLEAWRMAGGLAAWRTERAAVVRALVPRLAKLAAPIVLIAAAGVAYNLVRFGEPAEFGHSYLQVRQQGQIEAHGLFSYHYLARNLAVAFTLLPDFPAHGPFVRISGHGLALWFTTPALLLLVWPRETGGFHRSLWLTVALVAVPTFFYQNSGWIQFGYRFGLDYLPFLVLLLAVGGRPIGWGTRALIVFGIVVNLFGAITFDRSWEYYRGRREMRQVDMAYDVVVEH